MEKYMKNILIQDDFFDYIDELRDIALEMEYRGKEEIVQSLDRVGLYFSSIGWIGYRTDKLAFYLEVFSVAVTVWGSALLTFTD